MTGPWATLPAGVLFRTRGEPPPIEGLVEGLNTIGQPLDLLSQPLLEQVLLGHQRVLLPGPGGKQGTLPSVGVQQPQLKLRGLSGSPRGQGCCGVGWRGLEGPWECGHWGHRGRGSGWRGLLPGPGGRVRAGLAHPGSAEGATWSWGPRPPHPLAEEDRKHESSQAKIRAALGRAGRHQEYSSGALCTRCLSAAPLQAG